MQKFDGLSRAIPDMVLSDFVNVGVFRTITEEDRIKALNAIAFQKSGLTENNRLAFGKLVGAELILTGTFTEIEGKISINARIIKVETAESIAASRISGFTNELLIPPSRSLIKKVSENLLTNLGTALTREELDRLKNKSETKSIAAAVNNYKGEILAEKAQLLKIQEKQRQEIEAQRAAREAQEQEIKKREQEAREKEILKLARETREMELKKLELEARENEIIRLEKLAQENEKRRLEQLAREKEIKRFEKEAREKFKTAVEEDPQYTRPRNNLRRLMSLLPPAI